MNYFLAAIVAELVRFKRVSVAETRTFRTLKHNVHLCPKIEERLNRMLDCFTKYQKIVYRVQGINDRGTDLVLRYEVKDSSRYISFQVKSFDDMKGKKYLRDLKASLTEVKTEYGDALEHYYILLCTDAEFHRDKINEVSKAFSTDQLVSVIEPRYVLPFISLSNFHVEVVVDSFLRREDIVHTEARATLVGLEPDEAVVLLVVLAESLTSGKPFVRYNAVVTSQIVRRHLPRLSGEARSRNDEDLEAMVARCVSSLDRALPGFQESETGATIDWAFFWPMVVILGDAIVRYRYRSHDLIKFAVATLLPPSIGLSL